MLIDETNWKQERANLQSQRILLEVKLKGVEKDIVECVDIVVIVFLTSSATSLKERIKELDKAIETIENVFVHKRCYI